MKKIVLFSALFFLAGFAFSQGSAPVAVNDTLQVYLFDDTLTINVLKNDYDPEGDPFYIGGAPGSIHHTDSTITYAIPFSLYHTWKNGISKFRPYILYDTVNMQDSIGWVYANFHNPYYDSLDINKVSARINNNGNHFWDLTGNADYFVPKGSLKSAQFSFSFWLGGLDSDNKLHLAGDRYGGLGQDFWSGPVADPVNYSNTYDSAWNKLWKINRT
ncbi:MAG: hypothetical protein NTU44_00330, partial [Bacteroidetes bacterium]|nr:hypothetical protein [Bacteroidota bacterium]